MDFERERRSKDPSTPRAGPKHQSCRRIRGNYIALVADPWSKPYALLELDVGTSRPPHAGVRNGRSAMLIKKRPGRGLSGCQLLRFRCAEDRDRSRPVQA